MPVDGKLTVDDVDTLRGLLTDNWQTADRGGFYLAYYEMIKGLNSGGAQQVLMQTHISTYSGWFGGAALLGNALAKFANPEVYDLSLDDFSYRIAKGLLVAIDVSVNEDGTGVFDANKIQALDQGVWGDQGMRDYFPGNIQMWDTDITNLFSAGTLASSIGALQLIFGATVGYEASDYLAAGGTLDTSNSDYDVVKDASGKILFVQEKTGLLSSFVPEFVLEEPALAAAIALTQPIVGAAASLVTGAITILNNAAFDAILSVSGKVLDSLYSDSEIDFGLRNSIVEFVGANGNEVKPDGELPVGDFVWDDFPLILRNTGVFDDSDGAHIQFGYNDAVINAGIGEDLLIGFADSVLNGGADDDLMFGQDQTVLNGDAGDDILVGLEDATVSGGDGDDWVFAFDDVTASAGAGSDLVVSVGGHGQISTGDGDDALLILSPEDKGDGDHLVADTGSGEDIVFSAGGAAEIHLGAGKDTLLWSSAGSVVYTGPGGEDDADSLYFTRGSLIADADGYDTAYAYGILSAAGSYYRFAASEDPYAYKNLGLLKVGFNNDGELVLGDLLSEEGKEETFTYFANGNNNPTANTADLTAGIRVAEIEIYVWQLFDDIPEGLSQDGEDTMWEFVVATIKEMDGDEYVGGVDPLVLDLDGDGLELTPLVYGTGPRFDMDGDQFLEYTGWVAPDDGLLALDVDGNGTIDDINELFGGGGQSGFLALGAHDSNLDGVIDAQDTVFADLRVWRDLDRDGVTDAGELFSLGDLSISSISLTATDDGSQNSLNTVARTGGFTYADGSTGLIGDIEFRVNNYATTYTGDKTVSQVVQDTMPNLKGHGTLADLHVALTLEGTGGQLTSTINSILPTLDVVDFDVLRERASDILEAWTNAPPVPTGVSSNPDVPVLMNRDGGGLEVLDFAVQVTENVTQPDGSVVSMTFWRLAGSVEIKDAEGNVIPHPSFDDIMAHIPNTPGAAWEVVSGAKLSFLERYLGENIPIDDPGSLSGAAIAALGNLLETTERVTDQLTLRLAIQGGLKDYFPGIAYSAEDDTFVATTNRELIPMFEAIFTAAPADASGARDWIDAWKPLLDTLLSDYDRPGASLVTKPFIFTNVVAAYETVGLPISLSDAAAALGVPADVVDYGSGVRTGTNDGEIFFMSAGNDTVESKVGGDVFVFGQNFGQDIISDYEQQGDDFDVIRFAHLTPGEITATRDNLDLVLTVNATGDSVRVTGQFHEMAYSLFGGNVLPTEGIEEIVFADGSVWSLTDIAKAVAHPLSSNDTIIGTDHVDYLDGGAGNDYLSGGDNSDFYVFDTGYGHDRVEDNLDLILSSRMDIVLFGQGVLYDDLTFSRDGKSDDVSITLTSGDQLDIVGQFAKTYTGVLGSVSFDRIEYFNFENSTQTNKSFTHDDLRQVLLQQVKTDGDDTIYGFSEEDRLDGGAGDDYLSGGNENDTYIFGLGYGHDTIHDQRENLYSGETDRVVFKGGISADSLVFERSLGSLDLNIYASDGSWLTIKDMFKIHFALGPFEFDRIEEFHFTDDPSQNFTVADLKQRLLDSNSTAGDDIIEGYLTDDVLSGGAGNDTLYGLDGDDTYFFGYGFDHDTIIDFENNILATTNGDSVQFGEGITFESLTISRGEENDSLKIELDSGTDTLEIHKFGEYPSIGSPFYLIEHFIFAGDRAYSASEMQEAYLLRAGTDGDDHIIGFVSSDTLSGGLGNDRLEGREGADTYHWAPNSGDDVVFEETKLVLYDHENDKVVFGAGVTTSNLQATRNGHDLVLSVTGTTGSLTLEKFYYTIYHTVDWFEFPDGTILSAAEISSLAMSGDDGDNTIDGGDFAETLDGGLGNDILDGGKGSDTYLYALGDGNDEIREQSYSGAADKLQLTNGINSFDTVISRVYSDYSGLKLTFTDGGSVVLRGQGSHNPETGVEEINFSDGVTWTGQDLIQTYLQNTALDQAFIGFTTSDTFHYARGDGNDTILEPVNSGSADRLVLTGIDPDEITIQHNGNDAVLLVAESAPGAGDGGSITLEGNLARHINVGVEEIVFDDGTIWTPADLRDMLLTGTSANEDFQGFSGSDTFVYARGGGHDTITEGAHSGSEDKLSFTDINANEVSLVRSGNDVTLVIAESSAGAGDAGSVLLKDSLDDFHNQGVDRIVFADATVWTQSDIRLMLLEQSSSNGNDTINGYNTSDTLTGGVGDDALTGGERSDTYVYSRGDGTDTITESAHGGSDDILSFADINANEVSLVRNGNDVTLVIAESSVGAGDGGSVLLKTSLEDFYNQGVDRVVFADTTVWTQADLRGMLLTGTSANEDFQGFSRNDTYVYAREGGHDTITEGAHSGSEDTLSFTDINANEVSLVHGGNDVTLVIAESSAGAGDAGSVLLKASSGVSNNQGVEKVIFADGTIWTQADFSESNGSGPIVGTVGADTLQGTDDNDRFEGGQGDDTLYGKKGSDVYLYASGDGSDYIDDEDGSTVAVDVVQFEDINESDVELTRSGIHALIQIKSTGDVITLDEQFYSSGHYGIEQITFADGSTWDRNRIANELWFRGGDQADSITGTDDSNVLVGGLGDDNLYGKKGSDIYHYALGDGSDYIDDEDASTTAKDVLQFVGINAVDVELTRSGAHALVLIKSTGEVITFDEQFYNSDHYGIDEVVFADGTTWDRNKIELEAWYRGGDLADSIIGTDTSDVMSGGKGDDHLYGKKGSDTYHYALGDGSDYIDDEDASTVAVDVLQFKDIHEKDVQLSRSGTHVLVEIKPTGDVITLDEQFYNTNYYGIEEIIFADGIKWDRDRIQLETEWSFGTDEVNSFTGFSGPDKYHALGGNDRLQSGAGDDYLAGGQGSDTFVFGVGDTGANTIVDFMEGAGSEDVIEYDTSVFADWTAVLASASDDGIDTTILYGGGSSLVLKNVLVSNLHQDDFAFV